MAATSSVQLQPLPYHVFISEMKFMKTSMKSLMDQVTQLQTANRTLSMDVEKLMKNQDYNFDDLRQELMVIKKSLGCESSQPPAPSSEDTVVPETEEFLFGSDMVDVATIMGNGIAQTESAPSTSKSEVVKIDSKSVKQEEMDYPPPPVLEPCSSVASSSTQPNIFMEHVNTIKAQLQNSLPNIPRDRSSNQKRTVPWMETEEYESWASELEKRKMESVKPPSTSNQLLKAFTKCWVCQKPVLSTKFGVPADSRKLKFFIQSAAQTMNQFVIDFLLEKAEKMRNSKHNVMVCESHLPGYREACNRMLLRQNGVSLVCSGKMEKEEEPIEHGTEKGGSTVMCGVVTRKQNSLEH